MKLLALTGTLALVAALPNNVDYEDSPIALEASYEDTILGGASPYQKCNKQCKKAFKAAIRHQNKYSQYVSQACQDLFLIKSFPESYATQVVAGTKFIFKDFDLSCGDQTYTFNLEIVEQPWKAKEDKWNYAEWSGEAI